MTDKEEELKKEIDGSRAILRMLQRVDAPYSWGIELIRYAALLGQSKSRKVRDEKKR